MFCLPRPLPQTQRRSRFWRPCGKGVNKLNVIVPLESVSIQSERIPGYVETVEGNIEDAGGGGGGEMNESNVGARFEEGDHDREKNNSATGRDRNENEGESETTGGIALGASGEGNASVDGEQGGPGSQGDGDGEDREDEEDKPGYPIY